MGQRSWALCVCVLFVLSQFTGSSGCLEREKNALLHLSSTFDLGEWDVGLGDNCCAWKRVKCNPTTHRVIQISMDRVIGYDKERQSFLTFPFLNMSYFLPFEELQLLDISNNLIGDENPQMARLMGFERLSELKRLEVLNLAGNGFGSSILPSLGAITSLRSLNIGTNEIGGDSMSVYELSKLFTNLRNLEVLDLSHNDLNGSFPFKDLENMSKLRSLDMSNNNFSGNILRSLLPLSSLESLVLTDTYLTSSLSGFCGWKNLRDLDVSLNRLEGSIPPCLNNLTSIRNLDVSFNNLTGNIPPSLVYSLTHLEHLDFQFNQLNGNIPISSISNLTSLQYISFGHNQFGGIDSLHPFKSQLKVLDLSHCNLNMSTTQFLQFLHAQYNLEAVDLSQNYLHGKFPYWLIENNSRLENLHLGNNLISGRISFPFTLHESLKGVDISTNNIQGELQFNIGDIIPKVQILNFSGNSLEGRIPSSLGNLKELRSLDLSSNNFSGEIPQELGFGCKRLEVLILSNNRLEGQISPAFFRLTSLTSLRLNNNQLTGSLASIPLEKFNSTDFKKHHLEFLDITENHISGGVPSWIANFTWLISFSMRHNFLQGPIPVGIFNSSYLKFVDLSENQLSGSLPCCLKTMTLKYIHLHSNNLTGTIPKEFFESSDLLTLDLMRNQLSGSIPSHIGASVNLRILLLKGNHLSGPVTHELCKMNKIGMLDLSHNNFSGSIPPCLGNITFGKIEGFEPAFQDPLWNRSGTLMGTHPNGFYSGAYYSIVSTNEEEVYFTTKGMDGCYKGGFLNYMSGIDLSWNQFTGPIPLEIGSLTGVHALNFSHNQLTGKIPQTLSHLKELESMDLSHNMFSGEVPSDLIGLHNLAVFTVSYNNLSGKLPDMTAQFSTFEETSYEGNPLLCGLPLKKQCDSKIIEPVVTFPLSELSEKYGIDLVSFFASFVTTSATCLLGLVIVLCINPCWRRIWFDSADACIIFVFPFCSEAIYRTSKVFT